jgi:uncharacterized protein (PEP-CTERM system associated)
MAIAAAIVAGSSPAAAQNVDGPSRSMALTSSANIGVTATDNADLSADGSSDLVTRVTGGLNLRMNGSRLRGYLDYALTGVARVDDSSKNELQNNLAAAATAELLDNRAFVDVTATVAQQLVSPFGTRSADPSLGGSNRNEVASLSVVPSVRGVLGGWATYQARVGYTLTHSDSALASSSNNAFANTSLTHAAPIGGLGWSVGGGRQVYDFEQGRRTESDNVDGSLTYAINSKLSFTLLAGREWNDFTTPEKASYDSSGFRVQWKPGVRTSLSLERRNRYFGSSHAVSFLHRT